MTKKSELLFIPTFGITLLLAIIGSVPVKSYVVERTTSLGPLSGSAGMLASFVVFLLIFAVFTVPTIVLWKHRQKKETPVVAPKQVTYGYRTPVPR